MMWRPLIESDPLDTAKDRDVDAMIRDAKDRDYMSRQCTPDVYRSIKRKILGVLHNETPRPPQDDRGGG